MLLITNPTLQMMRRKKLMLEICPRGNHKDDHISLYPWCIMCSLNIHERQLILIGYCVNCLWDSLYLYGYSKVVPSQSSCIHMNIRLAYVLIDVSVLQVIDMEMSN
jgi:hypothetical protein